ncbi:hypothetical protein QFZ66_007734 [Streptomyces sp. B4I13]|uniref:hypothetical protein n=1 Tax=Streptomyces sp. B4I13 TaxID=3042271 RepID=UPI00278619EC|nr:hypothetical protein [Streptomyces sp. B4I13]MDQ0963856.1 hypothetical protein [Streptomyces sp. B4I13]
MAGQRRTVEVEVARIRGDDLLIDAVTGDIPACTDLITKSWVVAAGVEVLDQPFYAKNDIATAGAAPRRPGYPGCIAALWQVRA